MQEYGRTKGPYHKNWCCSLGILHPLSSTWSVVPRTQMLLSGCRPTYVASVRTCRDPMQFCSQLQSGGWGGLVLTCPKYVLHYSCLGWYILKQQSSFLLRRLESHNTALLPSCSPKSTLVVTLKLKLRSTSNPLLFFVLFHIPSSPWCSTSSSGETFRAIADR